MDISADLEELSQTNVAVVCAGAKSILDLGLTLEYLETKGVPVIGYQTDTFPAFFTRTSEHEIHARSETIEEIAETVAVKWEILVKGGAVIGIVIAKEDAMDEA